MNKIEKKTLFKIKRGYYLELLTPKTMKLVESTEKKINGNKNSENTAHPEIPEVVLVHCNDVNIDYKRDSKSLYTFVLNKLFGQLLDISHEKML